MKNFVQEGKVLELTAPAGGVVSGTGYIIGGMLCVAMVDAAATEKASFLVEGVAELAKDTADFAEGEIVYFDGATNLCKDSASGFYKCGTCVEAAATGDGTVKVKLLGFAETAVV